MSIGNLKDYGNKGNNFPWQLKMLEGLQAIANATSSPLTCVDDSIGICAGGNLLTSTTIGADTGLDVNIIGGVTLEVNLDALDDQVGIYGYTDVNDPTSVKAIRVDTNGYLQTDIITMPATFAEDTAHTSGNTGAFVLGVRNDSNTAMTSANGDYSPIAVNSAGAVAIQDGGNSITIDGTVSIDAAQFTKTVTPNLIVTAGTTGVISDVVYSISFASNGAGPATISVDGGLTPQLIPTGTTINLDAGGLNWSYAANKFTWNTTAVGASLIITYNS